MTVHVAVGVIVNASQQILLTRRSQGAHQGGKWEFPGGKVEAGETVRAALERELLEELDIRPLHSEPLTIVHHDYGDKSVLLDVYLVSSFSGEPSAMEAQPMEWVSAAKLADYDFPDANQPIVDAVVKQLA